VESSTRLGGFKALKKTPEAPYTTKVNYRDPTSRGTTLKGVPRWRDRFVQYGIKVSFWGSGTLKIVIYVENYPQKRCFRLADYHPLWGWGGVN